MSTPELHDLIVIGGGPAGLSASLTAESERLDTLIIDDGPAIGGQAATSSLIENYPGFPEGISGPDLMARIVDQTLKFNTEFMGARASRLEPGPEGITVVTDDNDTYIGRAALLATGVETKQLKARNMAAYRGRGVHYGPPIVSENYHGKTVMVVGGANSAGQSAVKLSEYDACDVHLLVRGDSIEEKMSGYLVDKVTSRPNITVHTNTEVTGVDGNGHLARATLKTKDSGTPELPVDEMFVFIGSIPKTLWLPKGIICDKNGFVIAGSDLPDEARGAFLEMTKGRAPYAHETSMPGVFVAGDARCGTNKRVALAVGDGAGVVPELHNLKAFTPAGRS